MITKTAWKNVWRNKVRSLVVITSVTIGIFAGAFAVAMMEGAMMQRIGDALSDELSHIQVADKNFRSNNDLACMIENTAQVEQKIKELDEVGAVSDRIIVIGMANSASKSNGVQINGIEPDEEKRVLGLYKKEATLTIRPGQIPFLLARIWQRALT
jgi:putative ABC transport system permease protein